MWLIENEYMLLYDNKQYDERKISVITGGYGLIKTSFYIIKKHRIVSYYVHTNSCIISVLLPLFVNEMLIKYYSSKIFESPIYKFITLHNRSEAFMQILNAAAGHN